jgi:hypothetical protein
LMWLPYICILGMSENIFSHKRQQINESKKESIIKIACMPYILK